MDDLFLTSCYLCEDGIHDAVFLQLRSLSRGTTYHLIAHRTRPDSPLPASFSSTPISNTGGRDPGEQDRVRRFICSPGDWWKWGSYKMICGVNIGTTLTLLQLATVLRAVNNISPDYSLLHTNCWWFARCVGLLLEILAAPLATAETTLENSFVERAKFPTGLDPHIILRNVRLVKPVYEAYVSSIPLSHQNPSLTLE